MAIDNYTELVDSIGRELSRRDLTNRIPDWIFQAEIYIARKMKLSDSEQYTTGTLVVDQPYIDMPSGFKKPIHIELQSQPLRILNVVSMVQRTVVLQNSTETIPVAVAYVGKRAYLAPTPTLPTPYHLFYNGLPAPLGEENSSNDLLEMGPDVLKYAALYYSAPALGADERLAMWKSIRDDGLRDLKLEYWDIKLGAGPARVRPDFGPNDGHR